MEGAGAGVAEAEEDYSVLALPPEDVNDRLKKLMKSLRSEFGGPEIVPHITVVGITHLTKADAFQKFKVACEGLKSYGAQVNSVATGPSHYECVFLLFNTTPEMTSTAEHCNACFGNSLTSYMPHLSLLYGDLTDEEKKKAQEKATLLDEGISSLSFQISRLALYKTPAVDSSLKSWEKLAECNLD